MDELVDEREEHYRNVNEELNEKASRLIEEANSLIHNVTLSVATPISDQPSTAEVSQPKLNVSTAEADSCDNVSNEDHLPEVISKLGTNAKTRYLAAKVRVLEEENAKLQVEVRSSHDEIAKLSSQLQEVSQERVQLRRQLTQNSSHLERLRVDVDEAKRRTETLALEKTSMERELEVGRREREKEKAGARATDAKLQRALDESERLRGDLERARADADAARRQTESLTNENRRLERQKAELISGFKKQMKLIDVLRRQKMLIEASRALKLTEEEFLKTLDWQMG